jgi:hypothetical protein
MNGMIRSRTASRSCVVLISCRKARGGCMMWGTGGVQVRTSLTESARWSAGSWVFAAVASCLVEFAAIIAEKLFEDAVLNE